MAKKRTVIDGIVYDTSNAERVGDAYFAYEDVVETLYRKKNGTFFMHCTGTRHIEEQIYPCTYEKAKEWAVRFLDPDVYKSFFGEPGPEGQNVKITVSLSPKKFNYIRELAALKTDNFSEIIEAMIDYVYEESKWKCINKDKCIF